MRKPSSVVCSVVAVCLCFMQSCTAREITPLPQTNRVYERLRKLLMSTINDAVPIMRNGTKFQEPIPERTPFPCNTGPGSPGARSPSRPTTVHKLRPGDIDVVGAMGDSITAGNGAASLNMMQAYVENRGLSFAIGGESTWRKYLTLPNILKEFNPKLVGYSVGDSLGFMNDSKFNVAEPIAMNRDLVFQAQLLIRRMKADRSVDFYKDWKIVTVLMGHNDFCSDMCYRDWTIIPENTRTELEAALNYLQENMPRALINLVPPLDVTNIKSITNAAPECQMFYRVACSCFFGPRGEYGQEVFKKIIKMSQRIYFEIVSSDRYANKEDFAVVVQPFSLNAKFHYTTKGNKNVTDLSDLAADCLHLSQKGHALVANSLWNTMLEPVGKKGYGLARGMMKPFLCPTVESPYIFTARNSYLSAMTESSQTTSEPGMTSTP